MSPRLIAALIGLGAILCAATGLYWKGRSDGVARERPKTEAAAAQARVAGLEVKGAAQSAERVEIVVRQRETVAQAANQFTKSAQTAEEAHVALDTARLDRLRAADLQLCDAAPDLAGCAPAGHAGGGAPPL